MRLWFRSEFTGIKSVWDETDPIGAHTEVRHHPLTREIAHGQEPIRAAKSAQKPPIANSPDINAVGHDRVTHTGNGFEPRRRRRKMNMSRQDHIRALPDRGSRDLPR